MRIARTFGWNAATEVTGKTPEGEEWRADVLATKGTKRIAFEVQWSAQTDAETLRRQAQYARSGIRCLWLFRQRSFPDSDEVPAVRIFGSVKEGLSVLLKGGRVLSIAEFLTAVFEHRFKRTPPPGCLARLRIVTKEIDCWKCGVFTRIVTRIIVENGASDWEFNLVDFQTMAEFESLLAPLVPNVPELGEIKFRYSQTTKGRYLSNGCHECGALIGDFFLFRARSKGARVARYVVRMDERWLRFLARTKETELAWGVFAWEEAQLPPVVAGEGRPRLTPL